MKQDVVLAVDNLSVVKGGREILSISRLTWHKGEFTAITGPNGAGKSTLLKALAFLEPSRGRFFFNGEHIAGSDKILRARRRMAMVFQDPLLLRGTAMENVAIGLKIRGVRGRQRRQQARYWLDKLNIAHLADRDVRTLSGGEAQRVSIARAMALEPDVLFLDEPFTYLDMPTKAALISELKDLLTETGTTTLMVSHDLTDMPFLADRIIVMMDGSVKQVGPVEEVLVRPKSRQVAEFLGVENIWPGFLRQGADGNWLFSIEKTNCVLTAERGKGQNLTGPEVLTAACIRPEYVLTCPEASIELNAPNVFRGVIRAVFPLGYYYRFKIDVGFNLSALASVTQFPKLPRQGDTVSVFLPPEKIHIFDPVVAN
ncbi:ABC transporter [Thermincola ferriacetica]|uniref:ABC transporter n=1 Tax=Thermincola ferriacetica TaxID=281456 RepID=A0A0L6W0H2_9FIRM|nr:ABC transporter ATP-binding protein [Thermincola ferriacetica]KNZ69025.1 ABC transporter [Thermincola ferriacetica]